MFKNHLTIAWRNLWKNKSFSAINILGLALGLGCSILIFLWVIDERSIDKFHSNDNQLYNVYERVYTNNEIDAWPETPGILAEDMKRVLPAVEYASSFFSPMERSFKANQKTLKQTGTFAGADFFRMFSYPLLEGNKTNALTTPKDIAISRNMAIAFFSSPRSAMGKTIRLENRKDFRVTAVFETLPENASRKFDYIINWQAAIEDNPNINNWGNHGFETFISVKKGTDLKAFEKQVAGFLGRYSEFDANYRAELGLQHFSDMYLHSNYVNGKPEGGRIAYVRLFSIIAVIILLIACINFMNLTTARSVKRAKEIGVRKVIGAGRSSLIAQFMGEALVLAFLATIVAVILVLCLIPLFNNLAQKHISLPFADGIFWSWTFALMAVTALLSGSYPALFLSSLKPIKTLKGKSQVSAGSIAFRKGLVVFQFVLSIVFIISTIVISKQVNYIQNKNLGYDKDNLIYIPKEGEFKNSFNLFKQEALKIQGIQAISYTRHEPSNIQNSGSDVDWQGKDPNQKIIFTKAGVGEDFAKTMNLKVLEGRDYSSAFPQDTAGYILNEEALKLTGYKNPIGKPFSMSGQKATIIGVIKNFHFTSLHQPVKPMVLWFGETKKFTGNILVSIRAGQTQQALQGLKELCQKLNPEFPFTYKFADESYNKLYKSEQIIGQLSNYFAFLAIFISCLGLFGLAMFSTEQRKQEIGIRKVLGASVVGVLQLISRDFLKLVFIAFLIASPIAWWAMNNWLLNYAYRIELQWWMFLLAGMLAIVIALVTISFQAVKAAVANPIKSLRSDNENHNGLR